MADIKTSLRNILDIDGGLGAALVDFESGLTMGVAGSPGFDIELAAAGNTEVVRAKKKIRDKLDLEMTIEDILISLTGQYHLIRMVGTTLFFYVVLDRKRSNLGLARRELQNIEENLEVSGRP